MPTLAVKKRVFNNVSYPDELHRELVDVFKELDDILVHHSGPFATNAVISSKWRQANDVDEFTKDGIKILRHLIVSEDAAARFAARMTRFVGIAVDSRCHDGTTTSMLTFCRLAIVALQQMSSDIYTPDRYLWSKKIYDSLTTCLEMIDEVRITEDDLLERCIEKGINTTIDHVRAALAYHMSMISSKGDHDLSYKISEVIKSCPKKIFGMFSDKPSATETDEKYILNKQDFDLALRADIGSFMHYNHKNDTQYFSDNAVIFATGSGIDHHSIESAFLSSFISNNPAKRADLAEYGDCPHWSELHEGKRNLIILSPELSDGQLMEDILKFNLDNPNNKITWFNVHVHPRLRTSLNKTLHYIAGKPIFFDVFRDNPTQSLVGLESPVTVQSVGNTVTLTGMYEKDGETYHPLYRDPEAFEPYTRFANETEELINFAQANITHHALDHDEVTYLTMLYRALTTQQIYDITVGGSIHDQYANRTVYEDAIGAALSAVSEGVVLGGYTQLAHMIKCDDLEDDHPLSLFGDVFQSMTEDALRYRGDSDHFFERMKLTIMSKWDYIAAVPECYGKYSSNGHIDAFNLGKQELEDFLLREPSITVLFQAWAGYNEQLKRCRDMLPRFASLTHFCDQRVREDEQENMK